MPKGMVKRKEPGSNTRKAAISNVRTENKFGEGEKEGEKQDDVWEDRDGRKTSSSRN